jgi:feruloyl esterase
MAPEDVLISSRDGSVSYPICVHPKKTTWSGQAPATQASQYRCQ